jgi:DNA-binding IclR family transcriptional regulator
VSEAELDTVLRLRPVVALSTNIVRDRAWFFHDMASIRRDGYGLSDDEGIVGMCAMGAPIFGSDDRPIAMIAISGPTGRWTTEARRAFAPTLVQATRKLSDTAAGGSRAAVGA